MIYHLVFDKHNLQFESQDAAISYASAEGITYYDCLSKQEYDERILSAKKTSEGILISRELVDIIGARNKILNLSGPQVTSMLTQLGGVKGLLETGALGTARTYMGQFKSAYANHADLFQIGIDKVNRFEQEFGL